MKCGGFDWNPSRSKLLREVGNANAVGRILRINDFNRMGCNHLAQLGLCLLTDRGPILTELGQARYRALPEPKDRRGWRVTIERPVA